jgi:hypothetical protein
MIHPMDDGTQTALERAFELAGSGRFIRVGEIRRALVAEGFSVDQITGRILSRQLQAEINKSRSAAAGADLEAKGR